MSMPLRLNQERNLIAQEAMDQHAVPPPPFCFPIAFECREKLDAPALEEALNAIVRRHPGLCSAIHPNPALDPDLRQMLLNTFDRTGLFVPGMFVQSRSTPAPVTLRRTTLPSLEDDRVVASAEADILEMFDYSTPPALKAHLFTSATGDDHRLVLVVSHLVADMWSLGILGRELRSTYLSIVRGTPHALGQDAIGQPEFALQEHECVRAGRLDQSLAYWRDLWRAFADAQLRYSDFGCAPPRAARPPVVSEVARLWIDAEAAESIRAFARASGVTPYHVFRAAVSIALGHMTGRTRLAFGGNFANRLQPSVYGTVGWLNNRHILPVDLGDRPTGREVLARVRQLSTDAMAHQACPLPALWGRLATVLEGGHGRVTFTFDYLPRATHQQRSRDGEGALPFCDMSRHFLRWLPVDLDVRVFERRDRSHVDVVYSLNAYPYSTVARLLTAIGRCVSALTVSPELAISRYLERDLPFLIEAPPTSPEGQSPPEACGQTARDACCCH